MNLAKLLLKKAYNYFDSIVIRSIHKLKIEKLLKKRIIIRVDGGICSQIHFYIIGRIFAEKGFKVEYDLSWYIRTFCYSSFLARKFDLIKLIPNLDFKKSSKFVSYIYKKTYNYNNSIDCYGYLDCIPPLYMSGYYDDPPSLFKALFNKYIIVSPGILDHSNAQIYNQIISRPNSIAVHVRRGDLSNYNEFYGSPASVNYFRQAISFFSNKDGVFFYFFSDEVEWVREKLIKELPLISNYMIVDINSAAKGYMDLILLSSCRHFITSKGSFGKYGALIHYTKETDIVLIDDIIERNKWSDYFNSAIWIKS